MNLIDLVKNQISGDMLGRISSMLGLGQSETRNAVDAGIPAILAGLTGVAGTNEGARKLDNALDSLDDRMVGNIGHALSSGGGSSLADTGSKLLSSLLGGSLLGGLGGAISKFTGLGGAAVGSLLGLLAPLVLGVLKGQRNSLGLDAGGLSRMLQGQKGNIMDAMPSGLGSMLSGVPGLSALTGAGEAPRETTRAVADTAYAAGRTTANTPAYAGRTAAPSGASVARWLVPAAMVLGIAGMLWWLANRNPNVPPAGATTTPPPRAPANNVTPAVSQLTSDVNRWFADATTSLGSITDVESAKAALPQLQTSADKLASWGNSIRGLPTDARGTIARLIGDKWTSLQTVLDRVTAIPGVGDTLRPVLDQIRNTVNTFRQT